MQLAFNAVESLEYLARLSETNDDPTSFEQIQVEGMRGVPHLHQDVISRVCDVVDTVVVLDQQTICNLFWRRTDLYIANDACAISAAQLWISDLDREVRMKLRAQFPQCLIAVLFDRFLVNT